MPSSTIDWSIRDGIREIRIEQRDGTELLHAGGLHDNRVVEALLAPPGAQTANYAFDVTPARLITGIITERGICDAASAALESLYPEKQPGS
jgi:methylthioribose-1-phosphate isomerase